MNRGGAETMIMNLYRNIDRSMIQFDFIVHTEEKCAFDDEIKELGGKIFRMPTYMGKNHIYYKKCWNKFFDNHRNYKIIHGHVRSTAAIYLKIAKKHGLVTIVHSHSTSSGKGVLAYLKNIMQYPIRYIAEHFFACSKEAGQWLFGNKVNFHILNNAIETKKFALNNDVRNNKRKKLQLEDKFVIGHIGRFNAVKNHDFLIDIFHNVYKKNKKAVLVMVGDGALRQSIKEKVKYLGIENNVIFTGVRSDIPKLLQTMDIFVLPSLYEGLPVTLIEAQTSGLPCIISSVVTEKVNISGLVEFISLKDSKEHWAEVILKYQSGFIREDAYKKVKKAGYDIKENAKWLESFYLHKYAEK